MAALTVRNVVEALYRYLPKAQRDIPSSDPDIDDPLPEALSCINATLQELAVLAPLFAANQPRSAYFRAPATVAVSGLTNGGTTCVMASVAASMLGCKIQLPGDAEANRILSYAGTTVTLQYPHLSATASGDATVSYDCAELPVEVITVLEPVRIRGGELLAPANSLTRLRYGSRVENTDYGRLAISTSENANSYFIDSAVAGGSYPKLRMMLGRVPGSATVVEYQARVSLGHYTTADAVGGLTAVIVPAEFVESVFLPLAIQRFLGSSVCKNADVPQFIEQQAQAARAIIARMRPQANKPVRIYPVFG